MGHEHELRARERRLLGQARAGDENAFAELVRPHLRLIKIVCYRIAGDRADDATQATLLSAWRFLDAFDGRAAFSTWLCQIARNAALAELRRRVPEPVGADAEAPGPDPSEEVLARLGLQAALMTLPPPMRAALVLYAFGGLSYAEIAAAEGTTVAVVKNRIHRGRLALDRLL